MRIFKAIEWTALALGLLMGILWPFLLWVAGGILLGGIVLWLLASASKM
jgi:hypothetical protein